MPQFIALVLASLGGYLVLLRPFVLFPLLLVISAVFDISIRVGPVAVHPCNILLLALFSGVLFQRIQTRTLLLGRCHILVVAIASWILFTGYLNRGPGTLKRILALGLMYCAFEATLQAVRSLRDLQHIRSWITLSGALAASVGWMLRSGSRFNGRTAGVFGNPNALGMFLAGCLPLTFSLMLSTPRRMERRLATLAFLLSLSGLWISGSRGGLVGALCGCVFVGSRHIRQVLAAGLILGGGLLLLTVVEESTHGFERMPNAVTIAPAVFEHSKVWLAINGFDEVSFTGPPWVAPGDLESFPQSLGARMMIWYQAVRVGVAHPMLGVGPGNSLFMALPFDSKVFNNCFNIYLASFVEGGFVGLFLHFLWLRILFSAILSSLIRDDRHRVRSGSAGAATAFMIHGLVEDTYFAIYPNWLIGIVFAMALRSHQLPESVPSTSEIPAGEEAATVRYIAEGPPNS